MSRTKFRFIGYIGFLAGKREIGIEVEYPASLKNAIEKMVEIVGGRLKEYMVDPKTGDLWPLLPHITVNNKEVRKPFESMILNEGDVVSLFSPRL